MKKCCIPVAASIVLGLCFLAASVPFLLHLAPVPKLPEGTPIAHFMAAMGPTGYMTFVKVFELVGGIVVMIPRLRYVGLLLLGPVIVNIIATNVFINGVQYLANTMLIAIIISALILFWHGRKKFAGLLN